MGNYNTFYKDYYGKINNKKLKLKNNLINENFKKYDIGIKTYGLNNYDKFNRYNNGMKYLKKDYMGKILIKHLTGALCLFIIFIGLRLIVTPETEYLYNFCRKEITREYSLEEIIHNIRSFDYGNLKGIFYKGEEKIKSLDLKKKLDFLKIDP